MSKKVINRIPLPVLRDARLKLDEVLNLLRPYLVSPSERQVLVELGADSLAFIEASYGIAVKYPELLPCFSGAPIFGEDFFMAREFWGFAAKLNHLRDTLHDTEMAAGNYGLEAALAFYTMMKIAARHDIPGARMIYEELKSRRPSGRRRQHRRC